MYNATWDMQGIFSEYVGRFRRGMCEVVSEGVEMGSC